MRIFNLPTKLLVTCILGLTACGNSTGQRVNLRIVSTYHYKTIEPNCNIRYAIVAENLQAYRVGCDERGEAKSNLLTQTIGKDICIMAKGKDFIRMCQ